MNQRYELRRRLALAIALVIPFLLPPVAQATPLTYVLLPGSTITPTSGSTPTGPTEPLTGTFRLVGPDLGNGFDAVALSFASPSFSITLNLTALNDLETFVSPISSLSIFAEIVDLVGLSPSPAELAGSGTYLGPSSSPTFLSYPSPSRYGLDGCEGPQPRKARALWAPLVGREDSGVPRQGE
jgi:hypothetical protein